MRCIKLVLCFIFLLSSQQILSQEYNTEALKPIIKVNRIDNVFDIKGVIKNTQPVLYENLSYLLLVLKTDKNSKLKKNTRKGEFSLDQYGSRELANITESLEEKENLKIYLFIKKNNKLLKKDSLFLQYNEDMLKKSDKFSKSTRYSDNDIEIEGVVIDELKTKVGKDYYDIFYNMYVLGEIKYPFIITIREKPSRGRSSEVEVRVGEKVLYKFFTKPQEEYLKLSAHKSIIAIYRYNDKRKLLKNIY